MITIHCVHGEKNAYYLVIFLLEVGGRLKWQTVDGVKSLPYVAMTGLEWILFPLCKKDKRWRGDPNTWV